MNCEHPTGSEGRRHMVNENAIVVREPEHIDDTQEGNTHTQMDDRELDTLESTPVTLASNNAVARAAVEVRCEALTVPSDVPPYEAATRGGLGARCRRRRGAQPWSAWRREPPC